MTYIHSVLITGASGVGKSTLIRGALEMYGSGIIVMAPGSDEADSYIGLDPEKYAIGQFDDPLFSSSLGEWKAEGHTNLLKWLRNLYVEQKKLLDAGKPLGFSVIAVDTISAVARLSYNSVLAKFHRDTPPAAKSPDGAEFYGMLKIRLEEVVRPMRALKGLGMHWIAASHPTEAEASEMQKGDEAASKMRVMPDVPGGFKNSLPSFFSTVVHENIGTKDGQRVHYLQWAADPKRITKSRLGVLGPKSYIVLPKGSKEAWSVLSQAVETAVQS